ncbi:hypothetical protein GTA08_BOTSDO12112 [Botryosphaeria dothidea]|uniref:F-box domain-containing protein n=1 Tax=Botryosphaeria dothidea TaxID=55169 RepID=A0A8H4J791_9PEZI|nr:hypothetical protein GTA08_BOTSDO12112 [Botryosphaeria dothidea]
MAAATPPAPPAPFRLLDLPAELRLRIYEHALTAPDHAIRIYYSYQRNRVNPNLALALLRTCRQVYSETQNIPYQQNAVYVHAHCFLTASPIIPSMHLPPPATSRLRRLFVVLDTRDTFLSANHAADFRPFQSMLQLRRLGLVVVAPPDAIPHAPWQHLLAPVIERVPARCTIEYGAQSDAEKAFAALYCRSYREIVRVAEVPREALMRAAAYCQAEQGCKSGSDVDWRPEGEVDALDAIEEVRTW